MIHIRKNTIFLINVCVILALLVFDIVASTFILLLNKNINLDLPLCQLYLFNVFLLRINFKIEEILT